MIKLFQEYVTVVHCTDEKEDIGEQLLKEGLVSVQKRKDKRLQSLVGYSYIHHIDHHMYTTHRSYLYVCSDFNGVFLHTSHVHYT